MIGLKMCFLINILSLLPLLFNNNGIFVSARVLPDNVYNYLVKNSSPLTKTLKNFFEESLSLPYGKMTSGETTVHMLMNLLRIMKAEKVLDIGTYAGFSAVSMASVLPQNGSVITVDITGRFWKAAGEKYANQANVSQKIDKRFGDPAESVLSGLIRKKLENSFDLCYIDADKPNYKTYYEQCVQLVRPLGVIALDNVLWSGLVPRARPGMQNDTFVGIFLKLNEFIAADRRVWANIMAVGDGLTIAVKKP